MRSWWKLLAIAGAVVLFLLLTVEDWRRDFTASRAEITRQERDPTLRPLVSLRTSEELVVALEWAARRLGSWSFSGTARDGDDTYVTFVRTHPLLRVEDEIRMRVRDLGRRRVVLGESRSRWAVGDLGRNRRNLRNLRAELLDVLQGAE